MLAKSNTLKKVVSFISILVMLVSPFLIAKPGLAATPKINHGIISYAGAELTSTSGYIPFYQIVENWHLIIVVGQVLIKLP